MLLSSKNFWGLFSYSTLASNIFKQAKRLICVMVYIVEKVWLFWNEGTFSQASSVQEVHVIFKWNNLQSLGKVLLHLKTWSLYIPYASLSELA